MLVNHSQVYTVLLDVKIHVKGFGFNALISKLETFFSKSAAVHDGSKTFHELVTNLNSSHPSGPYYMYITEHADYKLLQKCFVYVECQKV